ncbi:hypothetical protein M8332_07030 (plasmid) [Fructilactobacillus ixorae]|uniref:Uncharacterized protein n=1 Tax=Fructilactobacillus ixorae TaxID=1750535 RepID=A0ABY5C5C5_9LACO|nr:hypothetical protein [Fructilactobacillus ixorae]USS93969.1 hypothetical protein M8332_07030 [Fructilactobacillus ixorae]
MIKAIQTIKPVIYPFKDSDEFGETRSNVSTDYLEVGKQILSAIESGPIINAIYGFKRGFYINLDNEKSIFVPFSNIASEMEDTACQNYLNA